MRRISTPTALRALASVLALWTGLAHAGTELLAGKKLVLRQSAKGEHLTIVSRGRLIAPIPGGADDPTLTGAVLDLGNPTTGEWVRFSIPAAGWTLNALGTVFRYQGGRPRAAGTVRALVISHEKRLKVRGTAIGLSLDEARQGGLATILTVGSHRYCMLFDGSAVKKDLPRRFSAWNAAAPASCPVPLVSTTTSSTFLPRPIATSTSTTRTTQPAPASTSTSSSSSTRPSATVTSTTSSTRPTTSTSSSSSTTPTSIPPTSSTAVTPTTSSTSTSRTSTTTTRPPTTTVTTTTSTTSTRPTSTSTSTSSTTTSTSGFTCGGFFFCGGTCPQPARCVGGLLRPCRCEVVID